MRTDDTQASGLAHAISSSPANEAFLAGDAVLDRDEEQGLAQLERDSTNRRRSGQRSLKFTSERCRQLASSNRVVTSACVKLQPA